MTLKTLTSGVARCLIALTMVAEVPGFGSGSLALASGGNSYYVDAVNGSDSNNGSITSPWQYLDTSVHKLAPGDTLYVRQGTYTTGTGSIFLHSSNGDDGASGALKTVKAYPGEHPVINMEIHQVANYWRWEGLTFTGTTSNPTWFYVRPELPWASITLPSNNTPPMGHEIPGIWTHDVQLVGNTFTGIYGANDGAIHIYASNILIENNDLSQMRVASASSVGTTAIYVSAGDNNIVRGNIVAGPSNYITEIYDEKRDSSEVWTRWISNVIVENNVFYNPPGGLIAADGSSYNTNGLTSGGGVQTKVSGLIIRNNIVTGVTTTGIQVGGGQDNVKVYNNTVYQPINGGVCFTYRAIGGASPSTNVSVENNIFDLGASYATGSHIDSSSAGGGIFVLNNNLYENTPRYNGAKTDSNPIIGDPKFVNASTDSSLANFHLQSGSAAIDKGLTLAADVPGDKDGVCRPQGAGFDIGAYEFCVSGSCPATCGSGSGVIVNALAPAAPRGLRIQ